MGNYHSLSNVYRSQFESMFQKGLKVPKEDVAGTMLLLNSASPA